MSKPRRHYTAQDKVAILRQHLLEKVPISDLCDKHGIHATQFYRWQKEFFENGTAAFEKTVKTDKVVPDAKDRQIADLEDKLRRKHETLSEVMEEHVRLKKALG